MFFKFMVRYWWIVAIAGLILVTALLLDDSKGKTAKWNAAAAIKKAGYAIDATTISVSYCVPNRAGCGPDDAYVAHFWTTIAGKEREGYVPVKKESFAASENDVTLLPLANP